MRGLTGRGGLGKGSLAVTLPIVIVSTHNRAVISVFAMRRSANTSMRMASKHKPQVKCNYQRELQEWLEPKHTRSYVTGLANS